MTHSTYDTCVHQIHIYSKLTGVKAIQADWCTPSVSLGSAIQAEVGEVAQEQEVFHHVQSPCHLAEQQHPVPYNHICT